MTRKLFMEILSDEEAANKATVIAREITERTFAQYPLSNYPEAKEALDEFTMDELTKADNWQRFLAENHPDAKGLSFECAPGSMRNEFYEWRKG